MSHAEGDKLSGLPAPLPTGEVIVWQGRPEVGPLFRHAFHARTVGVYFLLLGAGGLLMGSVTGALLTLLAGGICLGVLAILARACARTSVYTLTNRRLVLRVGMALPMHFNLPLKQVASADLRLAVGGSGDIALRLAGRDRIAWVLLWPHVRPWRLRHPEPMLRAVADADAVARLLHRCCAALVEVEAAKTLPEPASLRPPPRIAPHPAEVAA